GLLLLLGDVHQTGRAAAIAPGRRGGEGACSGGIAAAIRCAPPAACGSDRRGGFESPASGAQPGGAAPLAGKLAAAGERTVGGQAAAATGGRAFNFDAVERGVLRRACAAGGLRVWPRNAGGERLGDEQLR